jgi:protein-disulfide isomerase
MKTDDHVMGSPDARVTLVQYGDYECPYSARAYLVLQVVLGELGDSLRYVFRNFPLETHPNATNAAEAAESVAAHAGEPAFWMMHAMLFENQDALDIDDLLGYAESAGGSIVQVASDLSTRAMRSRIDRDVRRGVEQGVTGTPAFLINGRKFDGDWADADAFTEALTAVAREGALH